MALRFALLLMCLILPGLTGCATPAPVYRDYAAFVREPRPTVPGQGYRVGVADELVVSLVKAEGTETRRAIVHSDGSIVLAGFGMIAVADQTCEQIADQLTETAADDDIEALAVRVETFASRKVFAFGQVQRPGSQAWHGANSVLDVLTEARPSHRADLKHVQVLRPSPDGEFRRKLTVDVDAMIQSGDTTLDVVLAEGDVIFVPATALGSWGVALDQVFGDSPKQSAAAEQDIEPSSPTVVVEADPEAAKQLAALRVSIGQLNEQLLALRQEQAFQAEEMRQAMQDSRQPNTRVVWREHEPSAGGVMPTSAERGGAGEGAPPHGVRFWGP